jgi:hypothetical protein
VVARAQQSRSRVRGARHRQTLRGGSLPGGLAGGVLDQRRRSGIRAGGTGSSRSAHRIRRAHPASSFTRSLPSSSAPWSKSRSNPCSGTSRGRVAAAREAKDASCEARGGNQFVTREHTLCGRSCAEHTRGDRPRRKTASTHCGTALRTQQTSLVVNAQPAHVNARKHCIPRCCRSDGIWLRRARG